LSICKNIIFIISIIIPGVINGEIDLGDYDNDLDLDVLLTGKTFEGDLISRIYINNGKESDGLLFTEAIPTFLGAEYSSIKWGDYDGDRDLDVLLNGLSSSGPILKVYRNDGNDQFIDVSLVFIGSSKGDVEWIDYDSDGDLDVFVTGMGTSKGMSKVYRNDKNDIFTDTQLDFGKFSNSDSSWGDINNDGDLNFVIIGFDGKKANTDVYYIHGGGEFFYNGIPEKVTSLSSGFEGFDFILNWNDGEDTETSSESLGYNIMVGSIENGIDVVSPMSDIDSGFNKIASNGILSNQWKITGLDLSKEYYSCVQAVDTGFRAGEFSCDNGLFCGKDQTAGDLNADCKINNQDIVLMQEYLNNPGAYSCCIDVNADGVIDVNDLNDLSLFVNNFNPMNAPSNVCNPTREGINQGGPKCDYGQAKGDVNGDGLINYYDSRLIAEYFVGIYPRDTSIHCCLDVDESSSGLPNAGDALHLVLGIEADGCAVNFGTCPAGSPPMPLPPPTPECSIYEKDSITFENDRGVEYMMYDYCLAGTGKLMKVSCEPSEFLRELPSKGPAPTMYEVVCDYACYNGACVEEPLPYEKGIYTKGNPKFAFK